MLKKNIIVLVAVWITLCSHAQQLSPSATISLITLGPTQKELYSAFGHTAVRVYDSEQAIDLFYNYGVFSFDQNFYLNFARGENYYQLQVYDYPLARDHYIGENRYVHEQILNLTLEQTQLVFEYLKWNARPENKVYLYDYFYDNCSTRPRDVLKKVLGDAVAWDESPVEKPISIRDMTDNYLGQQPWGDLGIDICLGMPMDKILGRTERMFLPDSLESGFDRAKIKSDSAWSPLVKEKIIVFKSSPENYSFPIFHPWIVFGLISVIILAISFLDLKQGRITPYVDKIIFIVTGTLGLLLILLGTATEHKAAANNLNVLWALPTNLVLPFMKKLRQRYFLAATVISGITLLTWATLPQELHVFLIPLVVAFGSRYWVNFKLRQEVYM